MATIAANLQAVKGRIRDAARAAGRDEREITLLAVSKTWPASVIRRAWDAGQTAFGENYAQEGAQKAAELADLGLEWHFIGPIQSNKTRLIAERFDWVHTVEREKIARRLNEQRPAHLPPLNVCLQVNIGGEASKSGVAPEELAALAQAVVGMPRLALRGLMTIPPPYEAIECQRGAFRQLRQLLLDLRERGIVLDTLSMGMSADMQAAIAEGATMVRVGTAIFGKRQV
jgi:pyridoxal phosphate enzyme (YggS family)